MGHKKVPQKPREIHDCLLRDFGRPLALRDPVISLLRPWTERLRGPRASSHHGKRVATESNGRRLQARNHKQFVMMPGCRNATLCSRVHRISTSGPSRRLARNTRRRPPTSFHGDLRCPPKCRKIGAQVSRSLPAALGSRCATMRESWTSQGCNTGSNPVGSAIKSMT